MRTAVELVNITETRDGAVFLIDDMGLGEDQAADLLLAFFTLAFDTLQKDFKSAKGKIEISPDPEHRRVISVVRGALLNGELQLLVYFGGEADPNTSLKAGLLHVVEVLATVRDEILEGV